MLMLPELIIVFTAFLVLILDLIFLKKKNTWLVMIAIAGVVAAGISAFVLFEQTGELLGGRFAVDSVGLWFKLIFLVATGLTLMMSVEAFDVRAKGLLTHQAEFLAVLLFSLSGMLFLVSSRDLISLYVSLELATIPLFALTAWSRTEVSGEGAFKYLAMGALGSAFFLYGLGLLFGLTGHMSLVEIASALQTGPALFLAAGLITAGVGFKLTLVPFHMWAPDAYQGAPTPVTAFLSVASKAAGVAVAFVIFYRLFGEHLSSWSGVVAVLATVTMTVGNLVAVLQSNLKRFMAYSAISQAGYIILGFLGNDAQNATAMVFYMLVYVVTNLAAFSVIVMHVHQTGREEIDSMKGLSITNPLLALAMMVALFGLAGIPPLAGFVGKFFLFSVAAKAGYYWLVGVAAVNSTVSLYYYLRIVRQMYIEPPVAGTAPLRVSGLPAVGLVIATVGSMILGVVPVFYERIGADTIQWLASLARVP